MQDDQTDATIGPAGAVGGPVLFPAGGLRWKMDPHELLVRIRAPLDEAFGPRLRGVVLYGSEARGQSDPDSDIDVLVLLDTPFDFSKDLTACIDALYPLVLEIERPIDVMPVEQSVYDAQEFALYRNARREGMLA